MRVSYLEMKGGVSLLEGGEEVFREDLTVHSRHQAHPVILPKNKKYMADTRPTQSSSLKIKST
jgi:hypothetical protein